MLRTLRVNNFAIIDQLEIDFHQGMTTITGETGAGKSILLGALKLVLGERADLKALKNADEKCIIEAIFNIKDLELNDFFEEYDLDYEDESILRRELLPSGKSRAFINDTPVKVSILQELSELLIDIHSQFNTPKIFEADFQLSMLDIYGENKELLKEYKKVFNQYISTKKKIKDAQNSLENQSQDLEYKLHLWEELNNASLKHDELEHLEFEIKSLTNVEEIISTLNETYQFLEHPEMGIISQLNEASNKLNKISDYNSQYNSIYERLISSKIELQDISGEMSHLIESTEINPERLQEITDRFDLIHKLLRKHNVITIEELIIKRDELESQTSGFDNLSDLIIHLTKELNAISEKLDKQALKIRKNRFSSIEIIRKNILNTLSQLGMENSQLTIQLNETLDFTATGKDEVLFLFSANKGMEPRIFEKSVSGGERSRLMLAIKKLLATHQHLPTLILDEIDTGISGKVANETGKVMQSMADNMQLLVITHLPQVASKGNYQLKVYKEVVEETTQTNVIELSQQQRLEEIAQMISGSELTEAAINQAKELMNLN
ncbi:DNA repair protein RecN [Empedobacter stercoris]|uniref:DNA repair protein RecN n=1 Tax=Empedobacter falsenii TaxID=343874 RepID=A0ABY8V7F1_9FLAO|nr:MULTISPECIES: DNA repair protein RecN [Empedobacter]MDM1542218.1 DNA repair protein RecN [Empedobacter sp. 189-2]UWX67424.1 DNA repair protein RecN [Empedobacter stercoris]WIH97606.1 DNA repair protein RecN [Empedobacter falsenii]HJD86090.1 DNA repair protein RecN [Empedobacter falsenii]